MSLASLRSAKGCSARGWSSQIPIPSAVRTLKSSDAASVSLLVSSIVNWISSQLSIPSPQNL